MNIQLLCSHSIRLKVETAVLDDTEIYRNCCKNWFQPDFDKQERKCVHVENVFKKKSEGRKRKEYIENVKNTKI